MGGGGGAGGSCTENGHGPQGTLARANHQVARASPHATLPRGHQGRKIEGVLTSDLRPHRREAPQSRARLTPLPGSAPGNDTSTLNLANVCKTAQCWSTGKGEDFPLVQLPQ